MLTRTLLRMLIVAGATLRWRSFRGIALGDATPLLFHLESWLREGGAKGELNERTKTQYRSAVKAFAAWCGQAGIPEVVEAIDKTTAGAYVTNAFVERGIDPKTSNRHISAVRAYWRWLIKRTSIEAKPWQGQSRAKPAARNGDRAKRPFTDSELRALLAGDAGQELSDAIRVAALSCGWKKFSNSGSQTAKAAYSTCGRARRQQAFGRCRFTPAWPRS
jgi:hypothetical protein